MTLRSILFRDDQHLQACLVHDQAHVKQGAEGDHVSKIQSALVVLDQAPIDVSELRANCYGPSTAAAVLAFKRRRRSGRIEARIGLRMMPTFPRSPLSFRTASFPQYGWKAGLSDGAFPTRRA